MKVDRNKIWLMFDKKCAYCGCELETPTGKHMHVDHVKSLSRNWWTTGCLFPENDTEENLFPTCPYCNRYKSSLSLESFRKWLIDTPRKLEKVTLYRNALRFGMIEEKKWDGIFWFERCREQDSLTKKYLLNIANVSISTADAPKCIEPINYG